MELTSSPKAASAEDVVLTKDELENLRPVGIDYPPPWRRFWNRCCIASCIVVFCLTIIFFIVLLIGAAVEKSAVDKSDSTIDFYSMPDVCGVSPTGSVVDHPSVASAHAADDLVMHCGSCGFCSNGVDITIYDDTKNTLTTTSTNCAKKAFLGGSKAVYDCFEEDVKFTPDCNDCWTENVMCDMKKCVFTCVKMLIFGGANNDDSGELNDCLKCDERRCGPAYIECAGANRRRSGIVSDIGRDEGAEVCAVVDPGWQERFAQ